jgi:hypothetical protein
MALSLRARAALAAAPGTDARAVKLSRDQRLLAYTLPWHDSGDACCGCVRDVATGATGVAAG